MHEGGLMSTDPRIQQALQLVQQGKGSEAAPIIAQLLRDNPHNADLWYLAAFATDDKSKRISAVKRALAIKPSHVKARELLNRLQPSNDLDALLSADPVAVPIEVQQARAKDYTNAVVICVVLYFVFWIPGVIANEIYYSQGRRMEDIAGHELPGVASLGTLKRVMFILFVVAIVGYIALLVLGVLL